MNIVPECSTELALYEGKYMTDACVNKFLEPKHPTSAIDTNANNPIDFLIDGTDKAIRLNASFIHLELEYQGKHRVAVAAGNVDRDAFDVEAQCVAVNNIAHSIFDTVTITMQGKEISSTSNYPYTSYFNTRFNFNKSILENYGKLSGWSPDDLDALDSVDAVNNEILKKRRALANGRKTLDLIMMPFVPLFHLDKIIPPNVSIGINLKRKTTPGFYLMHEALLAGEKWDLVVKSAVLYVQRLELTPEYVIGLEQILLSPEMPIVFEMTEPTVITCNVGNGVSQFSMNNMFNGAVPEKILIGFVQTAAYTGTRDKNPFNFKHCNISEIALYKNGIPFPVPPIKANFADNQVAMAYQNTITALECTSPIGPSLSLEEFVKGTTIFAFSTNPDPSGNTDIHSMINQTTNMRLEVTFNTQLTEEMMCIIYFERDTRVALDRNRNVSKELVF